MPSYPLAGDALGEGRAGLEAWPIKGKDRIHGQEDEAHAHARMRRPGWFGGLMILRAAVSNLKIEQAFLVETVLIGDDYLEGNQRRYAVLVMDD